MSTEDDRGAFGGGGLIEDAFSYGQCVRIRSGGSRDSFDSFDDPGRRSGYSRGYSGRPTGRSGLVFGIEGGGRAGRRIHLTIVLIDVRVDLGLVIAGAILSRMSFGAKMVLDISGAVIVLIGPRLILGFSGREIWVLINTSRILRILFGRKHRGIVIVDGRLVHCRASNDDERFHSVLSARTDPGGELHF